MGIESIFRIFYDMLYLYMFLVYVDILKLVYNYTGIF